VFTINNLLSYVDRGRSYAITPASFCHVWRLIGGLEQGRLSKLTLHCRYTDVDGDMSMLISGMNDVQERNRLPDNLRTVQCSSCIGVWQGDGKFPAP